MELEWKSASYPSIIHPSSIPYGALVAVGSIWLDDRSIEDFG
jgi:hypothetical protein